ncbi:MAG: Ig-like domain-containing protein, partial [Candidatus Neomarinimicrobiota bacterium]
PIIEVKSSDLLTQSTLNFATSTLQTDIVSIAKGEADEKLSQYQNTVLNLIASDQNIELGGLAPGISAIADSMSLDEDNSASINLLANDSYLGSASISITIGSASNGSISVSGGTATYTPNSNFNGTETISYTITQGSQTSTANLSITVNPVQDIPVISSAASVSLNEGDTLVISVNASDADSEPLSYTISGTDASMMTISSSGQISLNSAADYEVKTGYSVTVSVSDGTDSVSQTITVSIIDRCEFDSGIFGTCTFN